MPEDQPSAVRGPRPYLYTRRRSIARPRPRYALRASRLAVALDATHVELGASVRRVVGSRAADRHTTPPPAGGGPKLYLVRASRSTPPTALNYKEHAA